MRFAIRYADDINDAKQVRKWNVAANGGLVCDVCRHSSLRISARYHLNRVGRLDTNKYVPWIHFGNRCLIHVWVAERVTQTNQR